MFPMSAAICNPISSRQSVFKNGDGVTKGKVLLCFYRGSFARREITLLPPSQLSHCFSLLHHGTGTSYALCCCKLPLLSPSLPKVRETMTPPLGYSVYTVWSFLQCPIIFLLSTPSRQKTTSTNSFFTRRAESEG